MGEYQIGVGRWEGKIVRVLICVDGFPAVKYNLHSSTARGISAMDAGEE